LAIRDKYALEVDEEEEEKKKKGMKASELAGMILYNLKENWDFLRQYKRITWEVMTKKLLFDHKTQRLLFKNGYGCYKQYLKYAGLETTSERVKLIEAETE